MARSTCMQCRSNSFEVVRISPSGANTMIQFVQCARCGAAFGSLDDNLQDFIELHTKQIKFDIRCLESKVDRIFQTLEAMEAREKQMRSKTLATHSRSRN